MIIAFTATWCGPCKSMKPIIDNIDSVLVSNLDIDTKLGKESVDTFGVRSVPTLVYVNSDGTEKDRLVGVATHEQVAEFIDRNQ